MQNYLTTITPTHLLTYDAIAALGATMSDGEWRQLTKLRARLIMEQTFERIHDAPPEVIKRLRSTTLGEYDIIKMSRPRPREFER